MNFSKWQWRTAFAIDVLIKFALTYGGAVLGSLGLIVNTGVEGIVTFMIPAVAASILNFVYLMLGRRIVGSLRSPVLWRHLALQVVLVLMVANAMFVGSWTVLFFFPAGIIDAAIFGLICAATNLVPIMLVGAFGWSLSLVKRASCGLAWRGTRT